MALSLIRRWRGFVRGTVAPLSTGASKPRQDTVLTAKFALSAGLALFIAWDAVGRPWRGGGAKS